MESRTIGSYELEWLRSTSRVIGNLTLCVKCEDEEMGRWGCSYNPLEGSIMGWQQCEQNVELGESLQ